MFFTCFNMNPPNFNAVAEPAEANCQFCINYSRPIHEGDIHCAVNPDGDATTCQHYQLVLSPTIMKDALIERNRRKYEQWRSHVLRGASEFGIEVNVPEAEISDNWQVPRQVIENIFNILPQLVNYLKSKPEYQDLSDTEIGIALIDYAEDRFVQWCKWNMSEFVFKDGTVVYDFNDRLDAVRLNREI